MMDVETLGHATLEPLGSVNQLYPLPLVALSPPSTACLPIFQRTGPHVTNTM